ALPIYDVRSFAARDGERIEAALLRPREERVLEVEPDDVARVQVGFLSGVGRLPDDGPALLAQELCDVVRPAAALARRAGGLPAAEGLDARPGARRRARPPVRVGDAGLDRVEEPRDLVRVLAEDAGGEPVLRVVGALQRLVERSDRSRTEKRGEELLAPEAMLVRQPVGHDRSDEVAAGEA